MTFSDQAVVDCIKANFIPVWESIAPVSTVTYHLDGERSVKGILNGEIAVYFCRPDGKVIDILPGLHSPDSMLEAMGTALELYSASDSGRDLNCIKQHHADNPQSVFSPQQFISLSDTPDRSEAALQKKIDALEAQILNLKSRARELAEAPDRATHELRKANAKNIVSVYGSAIAAATPVMRVIAPRDSTTLDQIHQRLASTSQLSTPDEWKAFVFEEVLGQSLEGTEQVFASPKPMRVLEP